MDVRQPVRQCRNCGQKYLDKRWREPALVGFDRRTTDPMLYLKSTEAFLAGFVVCAAWLWYNAYVDDLISFGIDVPEKYR